ncbi:hypothetical protein [Geitlerinema sp. PCC 7407]|uniref:hypothetical protein n=1 Tax=Geitlerinema sp. PCC 7407 TaxID=1173025 RepID=UPI00031A97EB|nr:hypothetical protein [Geitlerinema sp. PCC 7407]
MPWLFGNGPRKGDRRAGKIQGDRRQQVSRANLTLFLDISESSPFLCSIISEGTLGDGSVLDD